jgi:hypothetical protein
MLKNTTVGSGPWEGVRRDEHGQLRNHYNGCKPQGTPRGASYLYWVDSIPDAEAFERYLARHPGAISFWLGGHTHTHPDDVTRGRTHVEMKWDVHHINAASLSRYHGHLNVPQSRLLTFTPGSPEVRVQCYMHTDEFLPLGWYEADERTLTLARPFEPPA